MKIYIGQNETSQKESMKSRISVPNITCERILNRLLHIRFNHLFIIEIQITKSLACFSSLCPYMVLPGGGYHIAVSNYVIYAAPPSFQGLVITFIFPRIALEITRDNSYLVYKMPFTNLSSISSLDYESIACQFKIRFHHIHYTVINVLAPHEYHNMQKHLHFFKPITHRML